MYNTDPSVPDWEKNPEQIRANNQEISAADAERAQAWAETFPTNEENPWLNADMQAAPDEQVAESQYMPQPVEQMPQPVEQIPQTPQDEQLAPEAQPLQDEQLPPEIPIFEGFDQPTGPAEPAPEPIPAPIPEPAPGANAELASTDNIVTNQLREVWNNGQGGQSLTDAYDDLRGSFTADNIKTSADMVETKVSDTIQENSGKDTNSEVNFDQPTGATDAPLEPDQGQVNAALYDLTTSAGATALGAQANAETATTQLMQDNESINADAAQQDLDTAKQTLEDIQSDIPTIGAQAEPGSTELQTAESVLHDAQQMVIDAQQSLEAAQKQAEERQEFIDEHQDEVKDLQDQGVEMDEINQAITETGNLDALQKDNPPEGILSGDIPSEDDEFESRPSIFG